MYGRALSQTLSAFKDLVVWAPRIWDVILTTMNEEYDRMILIDKPAGMTSFGVVARVRRVLGQQAGTKVKVGHTGTLDPFATGLMILVTGKKCREAMQFTKLDKWYEATIRLGQISSTGDPEGEITDVVATHTDPGYLHATSPKSLGLRTSSEQDQPPSREQIQAILAQFTGEITQRPPIFSAIKINGQRAYKLARDGKEVEVPERTVQIYALELIEYHYPLLKIRTHVSSGTYIRSLAVDIGEALGTGAYCQELRRTRIAEYEVAEAQRLSEFGIMN